MDADRLTQPLLMGSAERADQPRSLANWYAEGAARLDGFEQAGTAAPAGSPVLGAHRTGDPGGRTVFRLRAGRLRKCYPSVCVWC